MIAAGSADARLQARPETPPVVETRWALLDVRAEEQARLGALLDAEELGRAGEFRDALDRGRFIVRRGRLRELLAARLGCAPREVQIARNDFGKPFVEGAPFRFNLSHSCGLAFYVVAEDREVGCDIEWRRPQVASREAAERLFSAHETRLLEATPPDRWAEAFFNCWTRKEAFIKAVGLGLSYPLKDFDVSVAPGEPAALLRGPPGWLLRAFQPLAGLHVAIASRLCPRIPTDTSQLQSNQG